MRWFQTNTVRTGHSPCPFAGKANRGWPSTLFSLACNQSPSAYLFTRLFVYWRRRDSFLHLLKGNKKPACADRNRARSVTKWMHWKLKVTNTMLFTSQGEGRGVSVVAPIHKARHTHGPRHTGFCVARISGGVIERCEGRRARGLCCRSHQCVVTYLSNFLSCCTQTRPLNLKIKHHRDDVCLK